MANTANGLCATRALSLFNSKCSSLQENSYLAPTQVILKRYSMAICLHAAGTMRASKSKKPQDNRAGTARIHLQLSSCVGELSLLTGTSALAQ